MIDAAIVMIENLHKHLERAVDAKLQATGGPVTGASYDTGVLSVAERWRLVGMSAREVGPALFFSLLIITVSFIPVFTLEGQEGRLFQPLAFTKTFAMAAASLLSVSLVPVTMGLFIRGRLYREAANPVNRVLIRMYRPLIAFVLRHRWGVVTAAGMAVLLSWIPWRLVGSEFMPPLYEGTILYMPTTLPGISVARAKELLRIQDRILKSFPEVEHVWGKAGRANTATDPAGLDMVETTITLKPESEWRPGMTYERLIAEMDSAVRLPGTTNAWTMPIKGRIDMLATGIRTPVGVKIFGPDLGELERLGREVEDVVRQVPGTRSAFAERAVSGYYLDIDIDRAAAARHGLNVGDVQTVIATAVGGMTVTRTVEGRERYGVRIRYPQELRDTPERLASVLIPVSHGLGGADASAMGGGMGVTKPAGPASASESFIPLGQIATIRQESGPMVVRTEGAQPTAWVFVDVRDRDIGRYVADARKAVGQAVVLPAGYSIVWSGAVRVHAAGRSQVEGGGPRDTRHHLPPPLLQLRERRGNGHRDALAPLCPGGRALVHLAAGLQLVGGGGDRVCGAFRCGGGDRGDHADLPRPRLAGASGRREQAPSLQDLYDAVMEGAVERVRPKLMTVTAIMAGLLPILWGTGAGASVMKRIAAPMVGGMISSTVLTLLVIPAVYSLWKEREVS